jgi:hypothetical protein
MNRMQVLYPRLLGGLALVWCVIFQRGALDWSSDLAWAAFTVAWLVASVALVLGRRTAIGGGALAGLALVLFLGPGNQLADPVGLFLWLGLAVAVTDRRPLERALLVRVTVTTAYAFACLTKLNPSWLGGEQIAALSTSRSQLHPFEELFHTDVAVAIAWSAMVAEGALAVALWFRPTRVVAAVGGAVMSVVFIFAANNGTVWDIANIIVLTGLLVVSYLAFFCPIRPVAGQPASGGRRARATNRSTA